MEGALLSRPAGGPHPPLGSLLVAKHYLVGSIGTDASATPWNSAAVHLQFQHFARPGVQRGEEEGGFNSHRTKRQESDQVLQPNKGVIRPDLGLYRSYTPEGLKLGLRLPVVTQTSFISPGDIQLVNWESLPEYLLRVKPVIPVMNPLIPASQLDKERNLMLSDECRRLWNSVIDLVIANKARGYCIAKALTRENLLVSSLYGTVALKCPIAEDLPPEESEFKGFKAVAHLFIQMVRHTHGHGTLGQLTKDVDHWISVLIDSSENDGIVANYHPAMMSAKERAWLSVKFYMVVRLYAHNCRSLAPKLEDHSFASFHYTIEELDSMHEFFQEWRRHSMEFAEFAEKMKAAKTQEHLNSYPQTPEDGNNQPQTQEDANSQSQTPENSNSQPQTPEDPNKAYVEGGQWVVSLQTFSNTLPQ